MCRFAGEAARMSENHTVRISIVCALHQVSLCQIMQMQLKCVEYCSCYLCHGIGVTNRFGSAQSQCYMATEWHPSISRLIIIIIIIIVVTAIDFPLSGSSPYTSADKTKRYIHKRNNTKTQNKHYKTE